MQVNGRTIFLGPFIFVGFHRRQSTFEPFVLGLHFFTRIHPSLRFAPAYAWFKRDETQPHSIEARRVGSPMCHRQLFTVFHLYRMMHTVNDIADVDSRGNTYPVCSLRLLVQVLGLPAPEFLAVGHSPCRHIAIVFERRDDRPTIGTDV
ncbi:MAG: hypothetical protein C4523_09040 [Myxococcales bacterium]|nr:MAG: hypothetical protein C4523_09040 [Myxococcales bacterium]